MCGSVVLAIQQAMRMHHIILSSAACLAVQYFSTLSHKRHDFRKKKLNIKLFCVFPYNFLLIHFSLYEEFKKIWSQVYLGRHVTYLLSCQILSNLNFLYKFSKTTQLSNPTKICPVGSKLFHADGRTNRHEKQIAAYRNFANAPKNGWHQGRSLK